MHTLRKMQRKGVVNGVDDALKCLGFTSSRGPPFVTTMACPLGVFHSGLLFFSACVLRHKKSTWLHCKAAGATECRASACFSKVVLVVLLNLSSSFYF